MGCVAHLIKRVHANGMHVVWGHFKLTIGHIGANWGLGFGDFLQATNPQFCSAVGRHDVATLGNILFDVVRSTSTLALNHAGFFAGIFHRQS